MAAKRARLAQRRKAVGYTQEGFAEAVGVDRSTVVRWENGVTKPQPWHRRKVAETLEISPERLDALLEAEEAHSSAAPPVAETISATAGQPGAAFQRVPFSVVPHFTTLPASGPPGDTPIALDSDLAAMQAFRAADRQVGGAHLYATVTSYLQSSLAPRLFGGSAMRGGNVFTAAAGFTEMAGWMAHDAGHDEVAEHHFQRALDLGHAGGDAQLRAHIFASLSNLALHRHHVDDAIVYARQGQQVLATAPSAPALAARLFAMEARGRAMQQDEAACTTALRHAERALEGLPAETPSPWVSPFDAGSLASDAARSLQRLGRHDAAEQQARRIIELRSGSHIRSRAFGQLLLVEVLIAKDQIDEACALASEVLQVTQALSSHRVTEQLRALHGLLTPYRSSATVAAFLPLLEDTVRQRLGLYRWLASSDSTS